MALAVACLQRASADAVETLKSIAQDRNAPPIARVMAAKCILETAHKAVELEDVAARLDLLEDAAIARAGKLEAA